ncbi:Membrane-bound lysozyme inhibitor of C-type lysozyme precursor [Leminorella richardii]|uniref:Membrane-bound lysozyme inhibitor of C-type lysozyme n=1 Tax=Leminorella richardii TaxID=158841 RepID=A0A2X4V6W9_9GAMM|nr:MliC family protein [Leminorella richardii]SQI41030.1 Membrane-bound lysozyme inhibitor of C-type lysozyme precursor [Leminorella richardii]
MNRRIMMVMAAAALMAGCSASSTNQDNAEQTLEYQCETKTLSVALNNGGDSVVLMMDGQARHLVQVISASGAKYSDGEYTFWSKGDGAIVMRGEEIQLRECSLIK